jgi:hypothetical protein
MLFFVLASVLSWIIDLATLRWRSDRAKDLERCRWKVQGWRWPRRVRIAVVSSLSGGTAYAASRSVVKASQARPKRTAGRCLSPLSVPPRS